MGEMVDLDELTAPAINDWLLARDISDVTNKDKKLAVGKFGLLAAPNTWTQNAAFNTTQTTGVAVAIARNLPSTSTDSSVLRVQNSHVSDDQPALEVVQLCASSIFDAYGPGSVLAARLTGVGLGIGNVPVPAAKLHVNLFTNQNIWFDRGGAASTARILAINDAGAATIPITVQGSLVALLGNTGASVGINVNPPKADLHVAFGTNQNLWFDDGAPLGARILSINDAATTVLPITFQATSYTFDGAAGSGSVIIPYIWAAAGVTGTAVVINADGVLRKSSSSLRYKEKVADLVPKVYGDQFIKALRPVTYRAIGDKSKTTHVGLIAEEVQAIGGGTGEPFISRNDEGLVESLHYDRLIAPLIGVVQRLMARVEALEGFGALPPR